MTTDQTSPRRAPAATVRDAIETRHATRAFLPDPVSDDTIRTLLDTAARAPSGTNTQPWNVYVVRGQQKTDLSREIHDAYTNGDSPKFEYHYYPKTWRNPYLARRQRNGWGLYTAIGIKKTDRAGMKAQHGRNYLFFDAPVGLIFTIDRDMEVGSWLDYGMFLQTLMLAARGMGLDTCPQQSLSQYHEILYRRLSIPEEQMVICGMALGYADMSAPENHYSPDREPQDSFTTFVEDLDP